MKQFCKKHYILSSLLAACALELAAAPVYLILTQGSFLSRSVLSSPGELFLTLAVAACAFLLLALTAFYPLVLTGIEVFLLLRRPDGALRGPEHVFDGVTLLLGVCYTPLYLSLFRSVVFSAGWTQQLANAEVHTPIEGEFMLTLAVLALAALAGYLALTYIPLSKLPPLIIVLGFAGMYLACGVAILWAVQIFQDTWDLFPLLLPLNILLITARTIRTKMVQWNALPREESGHSAPLLRLCDKLLCKSEFWPLLAFLLMWPLLGILICLLALFGQAPSAVIRAWTETSDWNLSQRVAPQNIYYDEHYLCTVAAGGHRKVVKPLRLGVRHGHQVIVNRQLCVANAFEQLLEERTPRFHRAVRRFYDTYGFPIARLIHSPYLADAVYFIMKPLEWLFLLVLYAADVHPEDRIAVQYTGKSVKDFGEGPNGQRATE